MRKIFTIVLTLLVLVAPRVGSAQQELTVHNGTLTNEYVPIFNLFADSYLKAEMVYPAGELGVMNGGTITGMKFYADEASASYGTTFQVFLTEVANETINAFVGPGTVVYQGELYVNNYEMNVAFTTPYHYNGGNLLVGVYAIVPGDFAYFSWYGENAIGASIQGDDENSLANITPTQQNFLPKVTFSYTPGGGVTCNTPTQVAVSNVTANTAQLSWASDASAWQICLNGDESNLINVTTNSYTLTGLVADSSYTVKVRAVCANGAQTSAWSSTLYFWATDHHVIGAGPSVNDVLPSNSYYNYSLTQQIYTASEIGGAGTINSIAFYNNGAERTRHYDMYIVHTNKTSFVGNDWITVTDNDLVFSGEITMTANAWTVFDIDGFEYNGTSNIALIMDDNTGSFSSPNMLCRVFYAPAMAISKHNDVTNYDPITPNSSYGTVMDMKNQIMLDITPVGSNTCAKPTSLGVNGISAHTAVLTWTGGSGVYKLEYKRTVDAEWTLLAENLHTTTFTMNNLTQSTEYRVRVQSVCANSVSAWRSTSFTTGAVSYDHIYVTENGQGEGDSWSTATSSLQSALNTALEIRTTYGVTPDIWVAAGTYYGDVTSNNAFTMVDGVNVYGGFAGNEPSDYDLSLRNFATNVTILDGQNTRRVLYQPSTFGVQTTWDGFTLQHGYSSESGGGVYLSGNGRLSHCRIVNNTTTYSGGGAYCSSNSVVEDCDIIGNTSTYEGGGMYLYYATVANCRIQENTSSYNGGGLYCFYGVVKNSLISNNTATSNGGGAYLFDNSFINNTVVRNSSNGHGAGVYGSYNATLTNCILWGNEKNGEVNNIEGYHVTSYSAVEDGCAGDVIIPLNDVNMPLFVNPSSTAGASANTSSADWHLQNGSVCVNKGDNAAVLGSLDLDGTARIKRDTVDLGCYESNYYGVPVHYCSTVYVEFSDTACNSYTWNNQTYNYSGTYSQSFGLPNGCDSVVTLNLTIKRSVSTYQSLTICDNELPYSYLDTIFEVGTPQHSSYSFQLTAANGCDSIVYLNLTVQSSTLGEFTTMTPTNNYPVTNQAVYFTWDAVENASGYALYVWPVGEPQPQQPTVSQDYWTQCVVSNLQNHQNYQWFLKAYNTCDTTVSTVRQFTLNVAPSLTVTSDGIMDFGEVPMNSTHSRYFQVIGTALTSAISYQLSGTDASAFSLSPSSSWDSMTGGIMQISFHPTVPQNEYVAQVTIQSDSLVRTFTVKGCLSGFLTFTTNVDADMYAMNSQIPIHGQVMNLLNESVAGLDVEVYVKVFDLVRTLPATTDANGQFSVTFVPQQSESGYYTVGSRRLGASDTAVHDDFNIPGMMLVDDDWIRWEPNTAQADTGTITVRNRSQIPLTNIQVTPSLLPNGCTVQFEPLNLAGLATGELQYVVSGSVASTGRNYEEVRLNAFSAEGAAMSFSAWYYCMQQRADLDVMPLSITTTMNRGKSKVVDLKIFNNGTGPTGDIYVSLPDVPWMSVVGGDTLPSLGVHDSAYVSIRLSADSTTALIRYTGNIAINCERGEGVSIPYSITAISDSTGSLVVDVTDDYTYNTNNGNGPHLAGANVIVRGYYSLETVATGVTDSSGHFIADNLPEGWYKLIIRADRHEEYQNNLYITAGETNNQDIFIQFQAITYSWEVVPTEIEDEYTYDLVVEYETHVPTPVIVLEMPNELPALQEGESYTFDYVLTNHGLIAAFDVQLFAPQSSIYTFTPLYDQIDSLPAQTTVFIPCVMSRPAQNPLSKSANSLRSDFGGSCPHYIRTSVVGYKLCGGKRYPVWAYKLVTDGMYDPCPMGTFIPIYGGVAGGSATLVANYGSEPIVTPVARCECEDEIMSADTTLLYGSDSIYFLICKDIRNCVNDEIYQLCDTVPGAVNCAVTVTTNPYNRPLSGVGRIGVAADGASKMYIYVKSKCQLLSSQLLWTLTYSGATNSNVLGSISPEVTQVNDTTLMLTYTAPSVFPTNVNKKYEVNLRVMMIVGEDENTEVFNVDFPISIVRPPVLFVHGLGSDASCFADLYDILKTQY